MRGPRIGAAMAFAHQLRDGAFRRHLEAHRGYYAGMPTVVLEADETWTVGYTLAAAWDEALIARVSPGREFGWDFRHHPGGAS